MSKTITRYVITQFDPVKRVQYRTNVGGWSYDLQDAQLYQTFEIAEMVCHVAGFGVASPIHLTLGEG